MRIFRLLTVALAMAVPFVPAQAATYAAKYKIELFIKKNDVISPTPIADGILGIFKFDSVNPDFSYDFELSIALGAITYDTYTPSDFDVFDRNFDDPNFVNTKRLDTLLRAGPDPYPEEPKSAPVLKFGPVVESWALTNCSTDSQGFKCFGTETNGVYKITELPVAPIPLPATALLLPLALGSLVVLRRRSA